jgi:ferredoxin
MRLDEAHEPLTGDGDEEVAVRVRVHPGLCVGWGNCHRFAPSVYPLDEDGKVDLHLLAVPPELAYEAWLGAGACPEQAISVSGGSFRYWAERRERELRHAHDHPRDHDHPHDHGEARRTD